MSAREGKNVEKTSKQNERPTQAGLLAAFLVGLFCFGACQAQSSRLKKAGDLVLEPYEFENYQGVKAEATFGWFAVPANRSKENGAIVKLPFLRLNSTTESPREPTFYLSGGPGDSAIEDAEGLISLLLLNLREIGDVVVVDQRGTGRSIPNLEVKGRFDLPLDETLESQNSRMAMEAVFRRIGDSLVKKRIDPDSYTTLESAHDIHDLRAALGYEKIKILGFSYGTHLGLALIKNHPESVERAVLMGVNGLDHRWRLPADSDRQLEKLSEFIESDPGRRAAYPDFLGTVRRVLDRLERKPVAVQVKIGKKVRKVVVGKLDLQVYLSLISGNTLRVSGIPRLIYEAKRGDFERIAEGIATGFKQRKIGTAMTYLMIASSGVSPHREARIREEQPTSILGDAINYPFSSIDTRALLGVADLGTSFRESFESDLPVLLMSGELDGRTSLRDAGEVGLGFSDSRHVIVEGASHDFLSYTRRTVDVITRFLAGGEIVDSRLPREVGRFDLQLVDRDQWVKGFEDTLREAGIEAALGHLESRREDPAIYMSSYLAGAFGAALFEDKKYEMAAKAYEWASEAFPGTAYLHLNAATAWLRLAGTDRGKELGVEDKIRFHFGRALEINPWVHSSHLEKYR